MVVVHIQEKSHRDHDRKRGREEEGGGEYDHAQEEPPGGEKRIKVEETAAADE